MHASADSARVSPRFALRISGALRYGTLAVLVVTGSVVLSLVTGRWSWMSRAGGVLVLFGVLLSLRRLFRLGPQNFDEPTETLVINRNQLNLRAMHQDIQRAGDNYAQVAGVFFMILGTTLGSYGDLLFQWLVPLPGK